jgi:hypothetical protein
MIQQAALQIDPKTADVDWNYAHSVDPDGAPYSVVRECFARAPGSNQWVAFDELPEPVADALRKRLLDELLMT